MSATDGWLAWNAADNIVKNYQDNNKINGRFRLYVRDAHGTEVALKAWWWDITRVNALVAATNARLAPSGKTISGVRIYPALQNKDDQGNVVPDHHTLCILGAEYNAVTQTQDNVQLNDVQEFVHTCPSNCSSVSVLGY